MDLAVGGANDVDGWTLPERFRREGYVSVSCLRPLRADVETVWNETE
ncbi:MAG: hypothetical protein ACM3SU_18355 [Acidobacteriota bacterium]